MGIIRGFDANKAKVQLKLSLNRLALVQAKKNALNQNMRREIGLLLKAGVFNPFFSYLGKQESARVRVEHVIREDFLIEALELLQLYIDTLLARFGLLTSQKELDPGISEAVCAIIYAAPRVDVTEVTSIREQLISKFGKELLDRINNNSLECVNPRIIHKLSITTPDPKLVTQYLKTIANAYDATYEDDTIIVPPATIRPPASLNEFVSPSMSSSVGPSAPTPNAAHRDSNSPSAPDNLAGLGSNQTLSPEPDFDALSKRFESLRKKQF